MRFTGFTSRLVGHISWQPPLWVQNARAHPRRAILTVVLLAVIAIGSFAALRWWQMRPKPKLVSVVAEAIPVTPLVKDREKLEPKPLVINFKGSAAPLAVIGKAPGAGVQIEPAIAGKWTWASDSRLQFQPSIDWPADHKYRVTLAKNAVAPHVILDHYTLDVSTPAFAVSFSEFSFYQDPQDPAIKQAVATLQFTHRVNRDDLACHVTLAMLGGSSVFKTGAKPFEITWGKFDRIAYVRSASLALPEREDFMKITVSRGLKTAQGGAETKADGIAKLRIPDVFSFFKIESIDGAIVLNKDDEPEQFLIVKTSAAAKSEEIAKALRVVLLPRDKPATDEEEKEANYEWKSPAEVDEAILALTKPVALTPVPAPQENAREHTFKIKLEEEGYLFATVSKGVRALGEFLLGEDYSAVVPIPMPDIQVAIQGEGGVLALSGERKVSIKSRGVSKIEYTVARVPADQINHLVSQTRGEFQDPEFVGYRFGKENVARFAREQQSIRVQNPFRANYSAFDFAKYLSPTTDGGSPMQGLFFLKAQEVKEEKKEKKDEEEQGAAEEAEEEDNSSDDDNKVASDERFVLVTDLGLIVKSNADKSHDVYVASIKSGDPIPGVTVEVLAKNGLPLETALTNAEGRVSFHPLTDSEHEKTPVAFVARLNTDVSFMPYSRADRKLDFSRFEVGGVESRSGAELDAFVFTERGIYRPGDEVHAGIIVKRRDWQGHLEGLPVEVEVMDARGQTAQLQKLSVPAMGFGEQTFQTTYESPSGTYSVSVYLVRNGKRDTLLGSAEFTVKEFFPDRMKMETQLSTPAGPGWIRPDDIKATVNLQNLYGTPAAGRRIKSRLLLSPRNFGFTEFRDYIFFDRLRDGYADPKSETVDLGEIKTDDSGKATIDLGLERFASATYEMTFYCEGFEADSGRSVSKQVSAMVSSLPFVIGHKPDGDLRYVTVNSARTVDFIAIDPALKKVPAPDLQLELIEQNYVSVLTKEENGNYVYSSVLKERSVRTEPVSIPAEGLRYKLPSDLVGNFIAQLRDASGTRLSRVCFSVVGQGAVSRSLEKNAELEVKLSKHDYKTGEEIEVSITGPYSGAGLITIEREKVYAQRWFKLPQNSGVVRIPVPADLEGTGYVNVALVRSLDSKEIFMSPLSYAAVPFQANIEKRRLKIDLHAPEKAKPGEPFPIRFKTDRPAKITIFAVDKGILQVTDYRTPDPLAYFFRKMALMVKTSQIMDLILPEYSLFRAAAASGGDGDLKNLNPFKRITEKPVVFWSGVVDAGTTEHEVAYNVPDYFSGTLTVMAVASAPDATNSTELDSLVRGPFVITPNIPALAAPGDEFDVSVTVANDLAGSGEHAEIALQASVSAHLEIIGAAEQRIKISEGREMTTSFRVRAKEVLGSAGVTFEAALGGEHAKLQSTLSVRPPVPFMTQVHGGRFTKSEIDAPVQRALRPQFRKVEAVISALPLGLAHGLDVFLKNYPNGCSEQITSGAFSRLLLADEADFGLTRAEIHQQLEHAFAILRRRQNDHGGFGYWSAEKHSGIEFLSVYVTHFLLEAKQAGFPPPADLLQAGLRNLHEMAALEPHNLREARIQAYAIYVLTREAVVTTNYILNLRDYLDRSFPKQWQADLTGVYLAGSLALMKKPDEAGKLIDAYRLGTRDPRECDDFFSSLGSDAQYVAVVARHFPNVMRKMTADDFQAVVKPVSEGHYSTLSAAYAVLALKGYSHAVGAMPVESQLSEINAQNVVTALPAEGRLLKRAPFSTEAKALRFGMKNSTAKIGAYFQVVEAGFDKELPQKPIADGLEVHRDFLDASGNAVNTGRVGEAVTVRIRARSLSGHEVTNAALVDMLPGGFEIVAESLRPGAGTVPGIDFTEVREDRAVFFGTIGASVRTITYRIKPCNRGRFIIPPIFAESMYDRNVKGCDLPGSISVGDAQ